jgi:pimeloyl-ACP methyl ester carboxylesterase
VYLLLHGGGHSALSFALLAGELKKTAAVICYDLRAHGMYSTYTPNRITMNDAQLVTNR